MDRAEHHRNQYELWQETASAWGRERQSLRAMSQPVAAWMVEALDPQPGETILELAAGNGEVGFQVAPDLGKDGLLVQTDFAPNMVEEARGEAERLGLTNVENRVLDAQDMDLEDDRFDGVICRHGYMLMADTEAALRETRRVLRDGGRVALAVWGDPQRNPWAVVPARTLAQHFGAPPLDPFAPGGMFSLADPDRTSGLLEEAGLPVQRLEEVPIELRFGDFEEAWYFQTQVAGGFALAMSRASEADRTAVREALERNVADFRAEDGGIRLPGVALAALAG